MDEAEENPLIEVLLATHNGAAYLPEQIASLFQQDHQNLRILTRDDGSSDATLALLREESRLHTSRFQIMESDTPTGSAAGNFRELLIGSFANYIAFCDQDDVWLPSKLSSSLRAMHTLEGKHGSPTPLIVFSDLDVVDANLEKSKGSFWRNNGIHPTSIECLPRLLSENVVTGCTLLMNRPMADLAKRMPAGNGDSQGPAMHDHWIALLAATLGRAAWLPAPTVLYRQHGANVVGAAQQDNSLRGKLVRLFGRDACQARNLNRIALQRQAALFLEIYGAALLPADRHTLDVYSTLGRGSRWQQIFTTLRHGFWRGTAARNLTTLLDMLRGPG